MSVFEYGEKCATLTIEGDSDHAGCVRTRKSTSGGVARWGRHVLKWWSKTQPTLALSSGEAELAAIVRSTSEGLGLQSMMEEFGIEVDLVVKSDAVAAIGIVKRQGLGRVRHLAVADLWVQQKAKSGEVAYQKLEGKKNTSDMLTKAVDSDTLMRHMQALGMWFREGRNPATPAFNGCDESTQDAEIEDEYAAKGEPALKGGHDEGFTGEDEKDEGQHVALEEQAKASSTCSKRVPDRTVKAWSAVPTKSR